MLGMNKEDTIEITNINVLIERIEKAQPQLMMRLAEGHYIAETNAEGWGKVEDLQLEDTTKYFRILGNRIPKDLGDCNDSRQFIFHDGTVDTYDGTLPPSHELLSKFLQISLSGDEKDSGSKIYRYGNAVLNGEIVEVKLVEYKDPKRLAFKEYLKVESDVPTVASVWFMDKGFDVVITDYPGMVKRDEAIATASSVRGLVHSLIDAYAKLKIYIIGKEYMFKPAVKMERTKFNTLMNALVFAECGYGIDLMLPSCSTSDFAHSGLTVVNE